MILIFCEYYFKNNVRLSKKPPFYYKSDKYKPIKENFEKISKYFIKKYAYVKSA